MARIIMADDGVGNGTDPDVGTGDDASGGFVALAEALAARGHKVRVHCGNRRPFTRNGVDWAPIGVDIQDADLFIANRNHRLLPLAGRASRSALWIHDPAHALFRWRKLTAFARHRPIMAFVGVYQAASYPSWAPGGRRAVIPPATAAVFRNTGPAMRPPPPFAIHTAKSAWSLEWVLDVWRERIRPAVPKAQLYVFADAAAPDMSAAALEKARGLADEGVVLRKPVGPEERASELQQSRVFLHRGSACDMFCMDAAEAQAMGVPAVVCDVTCLRERVVDGETGFVVADGDQAAFAAAAIRLLGEDSLWRSQRDAALRYNRARGWDDVAADFEELRK